MVTPSSTKKGASLVILYGIGGLSDVGRHAILAAMERKDVSKITVLTEFPELLDVSNWECGCPEPHTNPCGDKGGDERVTAIKIESHQQDLSEHFKDADAVVSCLGHRQPGWINKDLKKRGVIATSGNKQVMQALEKAGGMDKRVVVMSSVGIQEDWPPFEMHWAGKIMKLLFITNTRKPFNDLNDMEVMYKESSLDYLFVRPAGLGEEVVPSGKWMLQKEKYKDPIGMNMAKLDCARYMVQEALEPTRHKSAVTIGSYEEELVNPEKKECDVLDLCGSEYEKS